MNRENKVFYLERVDVKKEKNRRRDGMKNPFFWIKILLSVILCLHLFDCAAQGPQRVSLDSQSKKFLDYVHYIILPVEEKIFREMPLEDRGEFIKDFWARRDPEPSTPVNEFRQNYYKRLAMADQAFSIGGKPGWKTDRGRIFILLGPPTNIIKKPMGDVPYEQRNFIKGSQLETGTLTERATEIWVYDNYPEYYSGPFRLVFVDYHSTGDYKLTTRVEITPYSMVSPTRDETNLAKYQWVGEIETEEKSYATREIFDYEVSLDVNKGKSSAVLSINIPYFRLDFRKQKESYLCDLKITAEIKDKQKEILVTKEEPFSQTFSENCLKRVVRSKAYIHKEWNMDLPPNSHSVYVEVLDNVKGQRLRKRLLIK